MQLASPPVKQQIRGASSHFIIIGMAGKLGYYFYSTHFIWDDTYYTGWAAYRFDDFRDIERAYFHW